MKQYTGHRDAVAKVLAQVEGELRQVDDADDQLGAHAEDARGKLSAELERRRGSAPTGAAQDEYLYLLRHQRQAAQVAELSAVARRRRGAG